MIERLKTTNVGAMPIMEMEFGKRLNIITGDNGLGKSFILDIIWWALTRKWPSEVNPQLTAGKKAIPAGDGDATIAFDIKTKTKNLKDSSNFQRKLQTWPRSLGRPANPGLVLYAMSDGSFAVWDPHRNYYRGDIARTPAYVFSPSEVWNGLLSPVGQLLTGDEYYCNGLIRDWASWQKENGDAFRYLGNVLSVLSPSDTEKLVPGKLTRISIDDVRDMPTIKMPYNQEVAVVHASAGIRRIIALAYFLVWSWMEHNQAAKLQGEEPTNQITFLIDEIESHLHPSWQLRIIPALLNVMNELAHDTEVQLITVTHSPLIMASLEPVFKTDSDAWFDINLKGNNVTIENLPLECGDNRSFYSEIKRSCRRRI
jgi:hypothetical protein